MVAMDDAMDTLKFLLLGVNALLFIALIMTMATSTAEVHVSASPERKTALLVTAHPDDESMFFLPLIHSLIAKTAHGEPTWDLHLLCLSRGNFDGLGATRKKEMLECGKFIGLNEEMIHVLEDPKLQDGMQAQWSRDHIATIVLEYIDKHNVNAVFTFDNYGVSGHANHIDTHFGVKRAVEEQHQRCVDARPVRGWALESTSIIRKYIGVLDALVVPPLFGGKRDATFMFLFRPWWNYRAMALHHSQFVWYRRLFVAFSRYTFINTLVPLVDMPPTPPPAKEDDAQRHKKTQ